MSVETRMLPGTVRGLYVFQSRLVIIHSNLSDVQRRCTLAHELTHVRRGDNGHQPSHVEARVNRQAAQLLISPAEYALAEQVYGPSVLLIAKELGVTPTTVNAYRQTLEAAA